ICSEKLFGGFTKIVPLAVCFARQEKRFLNVCFRVRYTWLTHPFLCGYCDRFPQVISNPVASELILPTVRTRRGAVARKLIGRWLHLSSRKIDYFGVGKRPECGVQSCLQSEGILSGVKP